MTYMNTAEFAPSCAICPMSFDEIDEVAGGPLPWVAVPIIIGGALLLSELFHHHT
jgi:hypothetical protein